MPGDFPKELPASPYPGLKPFSKNEARIFFGRNKDIAQLHWLINENPEPVTLLFGQSGVGKSSLLFAGMYPRLQKKWEVHYHRRQKETGLPKGLEDLTKNNPPGARPALFILDQVEEMFTNPGSMGRREPESFATTLKRTVAARLNDKFLLGFRSEYFAQIEELLKYRKLAFNEWFLKPLDKAGILSAIQGPADLYFHPLKLEIQGPPLPERIANSVLENEASHIAPLLQIQMRKLFGAAKEQDGKNPYIGRELFQKIWKKTLDELLGEQLGSLPPEWKDTGLALDLLHQFTTEQATATLHCQCRTGKKVQPYRYPPRPD